MEITATRMGVGTMKTPENEFNRHNDTKENEMTDYNGIYEIAYERYYGGARAHYESQEIASRAGVTAVVAAARTEALAPILALHKAEERFYPESIGNRSWDTLEQAREYADSDNEAIESFTICAECGRVESEQFREYADEWSFRESLWPCRTFKSIQ